MNRKTDERGITLVELITVMAIMVTLTGVASLGMSILFSKEPAYVAAKIDDTLTEARMLSMSKEGTYTYVLHYDNADPTAGYVRIDVTNAGVTTEYKKVPLEKSVTITVTGTGWPASGDVAITFDKAKGCVKKAGIPGSVTTTASGIYTIAATSTKNTSKTKTVTIVSATGRHYTD